MHQGFRNSLEHGTHENECRQRVLRKLQEENYNCCRQCPQCQVLLLPHEMDGWCCGNGRKRHWPWSSGCDERLKAFYMTPGMGDVSRMINSLFTSGTVYSSDRGAGFTYHVGHHSPCLRVSGMLYNRIMRTTGNCWFIQDASYSKTFSSLSKRYQQAVHWFRTYLFVCGNPFATIDDAPSMAGPPTLADVREGRIHLVIDNPEMQLSECVLRAVYVGPGSLAPERTLFHIGSGQAILEESPLWEIVAYPFFHPKAKQDEAWFPRYESIVGTKLRHLQYLRSVMFYEPFFWISSRIAHQFILDGWARNEQMQVKVWKSPAVQSKIRAFLQRTNANMALWNEQKIYLPSSVPGSYRYQQRFYHDALHMASVFGNPHLFITLTANPLWPEIRALLRPGESASTRLDVVARVFDMKRRELFQMLSTHDFLFPGHRGFKGIVWVTEWQLCGLPHVHIAVILETLYPIHSMYDELAIMDCIISAQYPQEGTEDYDLVETFMIHNAPCKSCLRANKHTGELECRFHYPKSVNNTPRVDKRGFPLYVRTPRDTLVVPHNIKALRKLRCHNNWEWVYSSGCICYLYKYFTKGVDSAGVRISEFSDEIAAHRKSRVLTSSESTYRILNYDVNFRKPTCVLCKFSLPSRKVVEREDTLAQRYLSGEPDDLIDEVMAELPQDHDILPDFENIGEGNVEQANVVSSHEFNGHLDYYLSRPLGLGDDLKFTEFYQKYYRLPCSYARYTNVVGCIVDDNGDFWKLRNPNNPILTRLPWISPVSGELYYLRKLILHKVARSWADLYCGCETFRQAAQRENLIQYDLESIDCLKDAIIALATPQQVRDLFVSLIMNEGGITAVYGIAWQDDILRSYMSLDFLPSEDRGENWPDATKVAECMCLCDLEMSIQNYGGNRQLQHYGLPAPPSSVEDVQFLVDRIGRHHPIVRKYATFVSLTITDFPLEDNESFTSRVTGSFGPNYQREIIFHMENTPVLEGQELRDLRDSLNTEQRIVFDAVIVKLGLQYDVQSEHMYPGNIFFVDAPAGSGKSYLGNIISKHVRNAGKICLPCATTGIAALMFLNGRTAHNLFGIRPFDEPHILEGNGMESEFMTVLRSKKWNARLQLLLESSLIIFDELPMARKIFIEAVDTLFRIIMNKSNVPFGGKVFLCLGDFRQISPIKDEFVSRSKADDPSALQYSTTAYNDSIKSSLLWLKFQRFGLTENVRAESDPAFHSRLMRIGNGHAASSLSQVPVDQLRLGCLYSVREALEWLFDAHSSQTGYNPISSYRRGLISPLNRDVSKVNDMVTEFFVTHDSFDVISLISADRVELNDVLKPRQLEQRTTDEYNYNEDTHANQQNSALDDVEATLQRELPNGEAPLNMETHNWDDLAEDSAAPFDLSVIQEVTLDEESLTEDFVNSLEFQGVPPHRINVWGGAVITILRNLDFKNGILNGTRMVVCFGHAPNPRVLKVKHAHEFFDQNAPCFYLPRILFSCKMRGYEACITRKQFPIKLCYGFTIHKSQSCTLDRVVVDLRGKVFDHGQLYVALSRVRSSRDVQILINEGQEFVLNIVHQILLSS